MRWLDKLERKYHKYAIHNLMQYIVGGMAVVFVLSYLNHGIIDILGFSPKLIMQGQVWRLFTFIFAPTTTGIWIIFALLILFFYGRILEQYWGAFKFNMYILIGSLGTIVASFILEALYGVPIPLTNFNMSMTLLLAAAQVAPDYEIRIYFVLPVKLKYLGYIYMALLSFQFLFGGIDTKVVVLFGVLNFLIFFGPGLFSKRKNAARKKQFKQANKPRPRATNRPKNGEVIQVAFHCCEVCGKTEVDDPTLEFRFCSKCAGRHEYCSDHIFDHEHKVED